MAKKKIVISKNYLEKVPIRPEEIKWSVDDNGIVTLEIENKGWANKIAQKFFKRPKISYVRLDKLGSFIWPIIDGEKTIIDIGEFVDKEFGEESHPLYERLAQYFKILDSYHFINWKETENKK